MNPLKARLAAAAIAMSGMISAVSCGGMECDRYSTEYRAKDVLYTKQYEKAQVNNKDLSDIEGRLTLMPYRPEAYYPPGLHIARCSTKTAEPWFEFYMVREMVDGSWELIGYNNGTEKASLDSRVIDQDELGATASIKCAIFLPQTKVHITEDEMVDQPRTKVGTVRADIEMTGESCVDDDPYYDNPLRDEQDL